MSRTNYGGPQLPKVLLDQVGGGSRARKETSRKDRRKAERTQKKSARSTPVAIRGLNRPAQRADSQSTPDARPPPKRLTNEAKQPPKSILKKTVPLQRPAQPASNNQDVDETETETDFDDDNAADSDGSFTISRQAAKAGLSDEDARIAALEKKLGMKGKKSSATVDDDDLDWLVAGSDSEQEDRGTKRKRPDDAKWLRDKRLKASGAEDHDSEDEDDGSPGDTDADDESEDLQNPFSEDELSGDDFGGFESDEEPSPPQKRQRENPYVAPAAQSSDAGTGKYVPPSLRKTATSDEEVLKQLRRQVQGQMNRLSEANLLSILQGVEQLYEKNARQHVTSTLVDLLVGLASDPSTLNDTFIILHAGFAAALYKVIGTDFGAQLLEKLVETYDRYRSDGTEGKQTLNIIAFLSNLYAFQVVGSALMFDYIRLLLDGLSETNTELLLRAIRSSGAQLRQDDPTALKDIVLLLQRNVAAARGEANLSVRTKFMIETINNLKNNRMKAGAVASAVAAEHTTRMRKTLGSLNTRSSIRATEPLRITLADIRDSEKKGKWWLVGASYNDPAKLAANGGSATTSGSSRHDDIDAGYESETPGHVNLHKLARQQGMNTDVRRAIFISILSAADCKDAHMRLLKLHLKAKQELEIPRVLLHCVGAEQVYNPYYTLIARKVCSQDSKLKKAFQFALWDIFRRLGEGDGGDDRDETDVEEMGVKKIVNLAKLYGTLIAEGCLSIAVLKTLEFAFLQSKTSMFVEVLLTTLLLQAHKKAGKDAAGFEKAVKALFEQAEPGMRSGLQYFIQTSLQRAELADGKREVKAVKTACDLAVEALLALGDRAPAAEDEEDDSD
ncbi:hypothetical protein LTR85_008899 [Meristemomyces frigidus]|nr:hypothetical protein LTR85_008899 [Meristemomyces frigidus]